MEMIMVRKGMMALVLSAGVVGLAACGVKSSPEFPSGSVYPRQYPAAGQQTSAPSASTAPTGEVTKTKETKDGTRSPLGFPLEYPNRPSYN